ncbi:MAG: STAS domain-containing protein [bacterium]
MKVIVKQSDAFDVLEVQGRIDGLTATELKLAAEQCMNGGARQLVFDCSAVTYLSSAGLRVFMQTWKSLSMIGGKMVLMAVPTAVMDVFRISGMDNFMIFVDDLSVLEAALPVVEPEDAAEVLNFKEFTFEMKSSIGSVGTLRRLGSPAHLEQAAFVQEDVVPVPQCEITYGAGLAVLGNDFEDYGNLFGEAAVINHRFFSYPAVKRPFVDFSGFSSENPTTLNFLYGFGFSGNFSKVLKMSGQAEAATVEEILGAAGNVAGGNLFGVVILAVSGGIFGMHLRKSPIRENNPSQTMILDGNRFAEWMNFSFDGEDIHKIIVATGIAVRDPDLLPEGMKKFFPVNSACHLHAVVFENGLLSLQIKEFESELERVMKEFEAQKVVHLLPSSRLQSGFIGIINLEAN